MAYVLHFKASSEIRSSMELLKFVGLNKDKFFKPYHAYAFAFVQINLTIAIEMLNMWNLVTITGILNLVMNFLALTVLSELN